MKTSTLILMAVGAYVLVRVMHTQPTRTARRNAKPPTDTAGDTPAVDGPDGDIVHPVAGLADWIAPILRTPGRGVISPVRH
jgi:hypothetical protein